MRKVIHLATTTALILFLAAHSVAAQTSSEMWRSFAERIDVGTELNVRLNNGRRFRATLVGVRDNAMMVQPKTRIPVPIQAVPYEDVMQIERTRSGIGAGKAVAIGVAAGVGAFFAVVALFMGIAGD
jgi:hypothetical protein